MQGYLIVHGMLSLQRSARDASLVDVDDSLSHHDIIVVIVQRLLDRLEYALDFRNGLAERNRDVVPLQGFNVLNQVIDWEEGMVWTLVVARVERQTN